MISNRAQIRKIEALPLEMRVVYLAGGRVTVGRMGQVDKSTRRVNYWYVAKIRGVVVSEHGVWKHATPEKAWAAGKRILAAWKCEVAKLARR